MDHMKFESPDVAAQNLEKLAALFPSCVTEASDGRGGVRRAVDFSLLRQMLSSEPLEEDEAYAFTWVGRNAAIAEANRPIRKTLRPCPAESRDWDTTENLYIEGDNLDVLKLLQESYLGRVRLIYLDPPYNTGHDFLYNDHFEMDKQSYQAGTGLFDEAGNRNFQENPESSPRFHSDWCSMLYPRLLLARNLLAEDGLIFLSIDDHEVHNLRKLCDQVFGADNYLNQIAWVCNSTGRQISGRGAAKTWESILVYCKERSAACGLSVDVSFAREKMPDAYKGFRRDIRTDCQGPFAVGDTLYNHNRKFNEETRPNLVFSIFYNPETEEILTGEIGAFKPGFVEIPPHPNGDGIHRYHAWRWSRQKIAREQQNLIVLKTPGGYEVYTRVRGFQRTLLKDVILNIPNGDTEVRKLFGGRRYFDYPKSVDLLRTLIGAIPDTSAVILDFFSGSATTAHAVMQLNAEDGGHRRFILVQLPEPCRETSEARRAGYSTICELGKERIRRAGDTIRRGNLPAAQGTDIGFRVLKLDSTNMADVYYTAREYDQQMLLQTVSNLKPDRTGLDLLFGCMLEWGLPLTLPCRTEQVEGCTVHTCGDGELAACFDQAIPECVIREIARRKPRRAVFRDSGFATSAEKLNVGEIFRLLAPETQVNVI